MKLSQLKAVIFDVDDTLLDNHGDGSGIGLHEDSRLRSAHEVGRRHGSLGLQRLTPEQARQAFLDAPVHTLEASVWGMLFMAGEVVSQEIEPNHPLLTEIMRMKEDLHEQVLRTRGREVPGACEFVRALAARGFEGRMAIASTANRRDIRVFLEMMNLGEYFPEERIISREQLEHPKPHPDAYNRAFAALSLAEGERDRVLAIEDDPRGVMSAKAVVVRLAAL